MKGKKRFARDVNSLRRHKVGLGDDRAKGELTCRVRTRPRHVPGHHTNKCAWGRSVAKKPMLDDDDGLKVISPPQRRLEDHCFENEVHAGGRLLGLLTRLSYFSVRPDLYMFNQNTCI